MHQIYSCSDENLEVFTVISSKSCSPVRRKAKSAQCILSKKEQHDHQPSWLLPKLFHGLFLCQHCPSQGVAASDYSPQGTEEVLSHQGDLIQVFCKDENGQSFSHLQNRQQGFCSHPAKCPPTHTGISKRSFHHSNHQSDARSLQPQASPVSHHNTKRIAATEATMRNGVFAGEQGRLSRKNTEDDISQAQGTEASLPLTGSTLYGTPSLLRKIWMKHKKKSEYLGATNSAFEAD